MRRVRAGRRARGTEAALRSARRLRVRLQGSSWWGPRGRAAAHPPSGSRAAGGCWGARLPSLGGSRGAARSVPLLSQALCARAGPRRPHMSAVEAFDLARVLA